VLGGANSTCHENFRRIDRAGGKDDLGTCRQKRSIGQAHPTRPALRDLDPVHEAANKGAVLTGQRGTQVGIRRGPATALPDRAFESAEAFLAFAVIVVCDAVARRRAGFDKGLKQWVFLLSTRDV
jgi:hypothetical protein